VRIASVHLFVLFDALLIFIARIFFFCFYSILSLLSWNRASISRALLAAFGRPYFLLAFYKLFWIVFTYLGAYFFVRKLIVFVETEPKDPTEGYLYALGLFLTSVASSVCIQQVMAECTRIGVQVCCVTLPRELKIVSTGH
jgi:hypothetical protein